MPVPAVSAATHSRVTTALAASESAVAFLQMKRVFQGRQSIQTVIFNLDRARGYLKVAGDADRVALADQLLSFYQGSVQKVFRPANAPQLAAEILAQEGNLAAVDPLLPSA